MDRMNWSSVVRSIKSSRSERALFFKPVCVIAAIDLADEGHIDPENVDAQAILDRFSDYVAPFFSDRGSDGYQPLCRLSKNQLWTFYKDALVVNSQDFTLSSWAKVRSQFDRLAINTNFQKLWQSKADRRVLRDAMLLMLENSDIDSRRLVAPLFDPRHLLDEKRWPQKGVLNAYFAKLSDQKLLFDVNPLEGAPTALENVPSAVDYYWSGDRMVVGPN